MINRRRMLKLLTGIPLLGGILSAEVKQDSQQSLPPALNLFDRLGIEPLINARGTMTSLSGSLMLPEVMEAINSTAHEFADMYEVQDKVGERIAELLDCEAAMVTSGAAGALTLGTAAAITGTDMDKIDQIPNWPEPKPEVIIQKSHRYVFYHAVRNAGVKLVEVEGARQMKKAIKENTGMALFFNGSTSWGRPEPKISREAFVEIGKEYGIPTFIDAAADVPPVDNLFEYQRMGFDLVTFSGGKMLRGPQSAGLLLGRKDLIEAAKLNFNPHEGRIGRPMKVNKEEIFGMLVALEQYLQKDHEQEWQQWIDRTKRITELAGSIPTVKGTTEINDGPANHFPRLDIRWDQTRVKITPEQVVQALREGTPRIEASGDEERLRISVVMLKPEQVEIVGRRIGEILKQSG